MGLTRSSEVLDLAAFHGAFRRDTVISQCLAVLFSNGMLSRVLVGMQDIQNFKGLGKLLVIVCYT